MIWKAFALCSQGIAFASKLQHVISKRVHMIKAAELRELFFDDKWHKVLLHGLTQGNVILCTVGDPYHLKPLSFHLAICNILSCFGWGRDSLVTGRKFRLTRKKINSGHYMYLNKKLSQKGMVPYAHPHSRLLSRKLATFFHFIFSNFQCSVYMLCWMCEWLDKPTE